MTANNSRKLCCKNRAPKGVRNIEWGNHNYKRSNIHQGAVVVAQLAKGSLPTPEVRGSNPNIKNNFKCICQLHFICKTKIKIGSASFISITCHIINDQVKMRFLTCEIFPPLSCLESAFINEEKSSVNVRLSLAAALDKSKLLATINK